MFGNLFVCRLNSGHLGLTTTRHYYYMLNTLQSIHIFKCMVFCTQRFSCSIPPLFYIYPIPLQQNSYGFPFISNTISATKPTTATDQENVSSSMVLFTASSVLFYSSYPHCLCTTDVNISCSGTVSIVTDIIFSVYVPTSLLWSIHKYFISGC